MTYHNKLRITRQVKFGLYDLRKFSDFCLLSYILILYTILGDSNYH